MDYTIEKKDAPTTNYPRFGIGANTDTLYLQIAPDGLWVSLEPDYADRNCVCEGNASITPLAIGTTVTFTQE